MAQSMNAALFRVESLVYEACIGLLPQSSTHKSACVFTCLYVKICILNSDDK